MVGLCWVISMSILWFLALGGFIAGAQAVWEHGIHCGDRSLVFSSLELLVACSIVAAAAPGWIV